MYERANNPSLAPSMPLLSPRFTSPEALRSHLPGCFCYRRGPERVSDWLEITQHVGGSTGARQGPPGSRAPPEVRTPLSLSREGRLAAEPAAAFRGARWGGFLGCGPTLDQEVDSPRCRGTLLPLVVTWGGAGPAGERMSARSLCGSGADAAPRGVWRRKDAEGRDAGLQDDRARERWCLPWVVWEESDSGRKPGRGQLTVIRRITPRGRHQPGQRGQWQQGALSRERSGP